jgi:acylphosphatase
MHTWHIHIEGQVQGVGFRPFVYRLAREHQLNGWVNNTTDGVHIELNAGREQAQAFCQAVLEQAPDLSRITAHRLRTNSLMKHSLVLRSFTVRLVKKSICYSPPTLHCAPSVGQTSTSQATAAGGTLSRPAPIAGPAILSFNNCPTTAPLPLWSPFQCARIARQNTMTRSTGGTSPKPTAAPTAASQSGCTMPNNPY